MLSIAMTESRCLHRSRALTRAACYGLQQAPRATTVILNLIQDLERPTAQLFQENETMLNRQWSPLSTYSESSSERRELLR